VRFVFSGTNPTTITGKVWRAGSAEPATAQLSATDSTTGLQGPGSFAVKGYLGGTATNAPVVVKLDNLLVTNG
jgi:large repetitive protein